MVEHIVHIDGVTGSSPVATTKNPRKHGVSGGFSLSCWVKNLPWNRQLAAFSPAGLRLGVYKNPNFQISRLNLFTCRVASLPPKPCT